MVHLIRSIIAAAAAFASLAQAHPLHLVPRAVSPVGSPVVVDGGGTYMRTTKLGDGTLIGGYATGDGANHILQVVRSTDSGGSWEKIGVVDSALPAEREIDNAFPFALDDGTILFAFRNHDKNSSGYTTYRITVCSSTDGGATWAFLSQVDERAANGYNGLWEPFMRTAKDGSIQTYYSAENSQTDQDNLMRASTDGGATWGNAITVSGAGIESRDGMTGVAEFGNGQLICVFENTETGPFAVNSVISSDDGLTWGSRARIYTAPNNREAGSPQVINVGGTLVTSFMSNEAATFSGVDGGEFRIVTSTDGATTWSGATVIGGLGSHWPGLQVLDDTTFLGLYSFDGQGMLSEKLSL